MSADSKPDSDFTLVPFFESSPDILCIAGFDGYFRKTNPAFRQLMGYTEAELAQRPINAFVHPDDQTLTQQHRSNLWSGKPLLNFENRYLSKSGDVIWLSWTSVAKVDDQLVYAIAKNITHLKEQEAKRNRLIADLTSANQRLKQLNYATSHDIRSPVSNLMAVFKLWDTSEIADPETLEFIEMLRLTSDQLKDTMDRYLDGLEKSDTLAMDIGEVDLRKTLDSVIQSLQFLIRDAKACFRIDLQDFATVEFNYAYLESVFLNLISNSIKYAHPDRPPVITISTRREENRKVLLFSDNGRGFDSERLNGKVFGLRQTFHNDADSKGIGLYLVHNHVTSLGGRISVESKVGQGATFRIEFRS